MWVFYCPVKLQSASKLIPHSWQIQNSSFAPLSTICVYMTTRIQKVITIATAISYITYRKVKHFSKSASTVLQRVMCSCGMFGMEVNNMDVNSCIIQEGYFFILTSCFGYAFMLI